MSKLTEGMVIARTRATDLENVKRLNCWGSELTDVSLIRKLSNVEVLSLSVNNIKSLADFQYCHNLQELYIRKNQIKDIEDIWYLKELPKLRNLWLEDNPCAVGDKYRLTVLRMLPQLQKLDNLVVLPEELREAALYGLQLENPEDKNKNDFTFMSTSTSSLSHSSRSDNEHKNSRCTNNEYDIFNSNTRQQNRREEQMNRREEEINRREEQLRQEELDRRALQIKEEEYRRRIQAQKEEEQRKELERRSSQQTLSHGRASAIFGGFGGEPGSFSPPVGNRPVSNPLPDTNAVYQSRPHPVEIFKEEENANIRISNSQESNQMSYSNMTSSTHGRISPARPYPVRPKTRNSNILSAVLCLIKELDYASLEVVEMAVRCRMDELDD